MHTNPVPETRAGMIHADRARPARTTTSLPTFFAEVAERLYNRQAGKEPLVPGRARVAWLCRPGDGHPGAGLDRDDGTNRLTAGNDKFHAGLHRAGALRHRPLDGSTRRVQATYSALSHIPRQPLYGARQAGSPRRFVNLAPLHRARPRPGGDHELRQRDALPAGNGAVAGGRRTPRRCGTLPTAGTGRDARLAF